MAYTYAGQWGSEAILSTAGALLKNTSVTVYLRGTTNLASLYTDRTKGAGAANPTTTDANGNLTFYADPGLYDLLIQALTVGIEVFPDSAEFMLANGAYATTGSVAASTKVVGDAWGQFVILADGTHKWGPGNATSDVIGSRSTTRTFQFQSSLYVLSQAAADKVLVVRGATAQTGVLAEFRDINNIALSAILASGAFVLGDPAGGRAKTIKADLSASPYDKLVLQSAGSTGGWYGQISFDVSYNGGALVTAMRIRNDGSVMPWMYMDGYVQLNDPGAALYSTTASAGAASALPATPKGYYAFIDKNGSTMKVPYYGN